MSEAQPAAEEPTDVFVSYRRTDREFVDALVSSLEGRGAAVWWDADIGGGQDWRESIVDKLQDSQFMLLVFSEECNNSTELKKELAVASHLKKDVVPVLIENTEPRGPYLYELAGRNWINIAPDAHTKVELLTDRLVGQITRPLQPPGQGPAPVAPPEPAQPPSPTPTATPDSRQSGALTPPPTHVAQAPVTPAPAAAQHSTDPGPTPDAGEALDPGTSWASQPPTADTLARADGEGRTATRSSRARSRRRQVDRAELEAAIKADARPDRRDFLPFRWFDFILPALAFLIILPADEEDLTGVELLGMAIGMGMFVLGVVCAIAFPVRYYRRRRSPYRVLAMLSLSNVVLAAGSAMGFFLASGYLNDGDPDLEGNTVGDDLATSAFMGLFLFILLSVPAFILFWVLSKRRAARELRADMESL